MTRGGWVGVVVLIGACGANPTGPSTSVPLPPPLATATADTSPSPPVSGWSDNFSTGTLSARWAMAAYASPLRLQPMRGRYAPEQITLAEGMLGLRLDQQADGSSIGAQIQSVERYGFGRYTWRARLSSTAMTPTSAGTAQSGAVSALYLYDSGGTEIDFEQENANPTLLHCFNWIGATRAGFETVINRPDQDFHDYAFLWLPDRIEWFVDSAPVGVQYGNIPQTPAYVLIAHWGANNLTWAGVATPGVTRMLWVSQVSFEPR